MMSHTEKIAVTVPAGTLREVESIRRTLGRSRSSIVTEALDAWLRTRSASDRDRAYLAAYTRVPEQEDGEIAAAVMASWDSWDPKPQGRARRGTTARVKRPR